MYWHACLRKLLVSASSFASASSCLSFLSSNTAWADSSVIWLCEVCSLLWSRDSCLWLSCTAASCTQVLKLCARVRCRQKLPGTANYHLTAQLVYDSLLLLLLMLQNSPGSPHFDTIGAHVWSAKPPRLSPSRSDDLAKTTVGCSDADQGPFFE